MRSLDATLFYTFVKLIDIITIKGTNNFDGISSVSPHVKLLLRWLTHRPLLKLDSNYARFGVG